VSDVGAPGAGGAFGTEGPTAPAPAWTVPGVGTGVVRLGTSAKAPGFGATAAGDLDGLPSWLGFLKIHDKSASIPLWIIITCALTMAAGTYAGGWRIIKTLGHKMVKMKPVHGFAAETTAATILATTGYLGMPVSTTHTITTSIMGVGAAKRWNAIQWSLVERILWAWVLTIPATALLSWLIFKICQMFGAS
jgi:PiT family inorganic phosphate transporter